MRHQTCAYDGTDHRADKSDCCSRNEALSDRRFYTDHKRDDDQAHPEAGPDVGERGNLILFKIPLKRRVVCQRQYCWIIREKAGEDTDNGGPRQIVNRLDQRGQNAIQERCYAELIEKLRDRTSYDGDRHNFEYR